MDQFKDYGIFKEGRE